MCCTDFPRTFPLLEVSPCRVCGHSIPGRDHHCVGHLGEWNARKLNGMGNLNVAKGPFKIVGGSYHLTITRLKYIHPPPLLS